MCSMEVDESDIQQHLMVYHPLFTAILQALYLPEDTHPFVNEDESYEELVELCESMGNVSIGVTDIDDVTSVIIKDARGEDACPICLQTMPDECEYIRRIHQCRHEFCGFCIEKWLKDHKQCPVCKCDLQVVQTNET